MRKVSFVCVIHEYNFANPLCRYNYLWPNASKDQWILPLVEVFAKDLASIT